MKKILAFAVLFIALANNIQAAIKRIGYWGTPVTGIDYATPALAVAACANGDSIYVYGSNAGVAWELNLTKRLVIIGSGYFYASYTGLNYNAELQNYPSASYAVVDLSDGSTGSIITGITGRVFANGSHVNSINNIRISNCNWTGTGASIILKDGITYDGWEISKCYASSGMNFDNPNSKLTNFKILNNIFAVGSVVFGITPGQIGIIENCTFIHGNTGSPVNFGGVSITVKNCIFTFANANTGNPSSYFYAFNNAYFNNCVFDVTPIPSISGTNNIIIPTIYNNPNIYIGWPNIGTLSYDARFTLKAGSPAIGAGIGGIDCGAFGGVNPYKLSGIPAVPAFTKLTAPSNSANTNPYTITFSVKANK